MERAASLAAARTCAQPPRPASDRRATRAGHRERRSSPPRRAWRRRESHVSAQVSCTLRLRGSACMRTDVTQRPPEAEAPQRASSLPALVLDSLEMGAVALDRERRVVYANRRIEELLGVEPGALLGLPGNRVFPGADARWLKGAARESRDFHIEAGDRDLTLRGESVPMPDEDR